MANESIKVVFEPLDQLNQGALRSLRFAKKSGGITQMGEEAPPGPAYELELRCKWISSWSHQMRLVGA